MLEIYKKNNVIKSARQREKELINISESLMKCYNIVKPNFFDVNYIFDFSYLTRNMRQLKSTQEEVTIIIYALRFVLMNLANRILGSCRVKPVLPDNKSIPRHYGCYYESK